MKCILCAEQVVNAYDGLCESCYLENYSPVEGFKKFNFSYCAICGAYRFGVKWMPKMELQDAIKKTFLHNMRLKTTPEVFETTIVLPKHKKKVGSKVNAEITVSLKAKVPSSSKKELYKEEEYQIPLKISYTLCDVCNKKKTEYFEGRIQLRNRKNIDFRIAEEFIRGMIKSRTDVFLTKEEELPEGTDFFISSQKYVTNIGNELFKKFGGELNITSKLFSRDKQTSKDLFRVDALLRMPEFNRGDIIAINQKLVLVSAMHEKKIIGINVMNHAQVSENVDRGFELKASYNQIYDVIVTRRKPLEVLHPINYQSTIVVNQEYAKKDELINEKVTVMLIDDQVYIV